MSVCFIRQRQLNARFAALQSARQSRLASTRLSCRTRPAIPTGERPDERHSSQAHHTFWPAPALPRRRRSSFHQVINFFIGKNQWASRGERQMGHSGADQPCTDPAPHLAKLMRSVPRGDHLSRGRNWIVGAVRRDRTALPLRLPRDVMWTDPLIKSRAKGSCQTGVAAPHRA